MPRTPAYLLSILEEHFEELQMLWELRSAALKDPDYRGEDIVELDERIEAHVDGLVLGDEHSLPLLEESLGSDDPLVSFAAAYTMLRMRDEELAKKVVEAFETAGDEAGDGIREALRLGPLEFLEEPLTEAALSAPAPAAAAAAEILAFHDKLDALPGRWDEFCSHEDPRVRRMAWRILAMVGADGTWVD